MKILNFVFFAIAFSLFLYSRPCVAQNDSTVLSFNDFVRNILLYHPIAQQADLQQDFADVAWLAAKGQFDPALSSDWNDKYFDDKHYYRIFNAGFQIPTWFGLSLAGSYENTTGVYLNPENTTTNNGLWMLGVEANVLQGLLIDERRTALQQAKIYRLAAANERRRMLNKVLYGASQAYNTWQAIFYTQRIIEESIDLAQEYLEATRQAFSNGDKPAIDTLEAFMIVQDRRIRLQSNSVELLKAKQILENYLWFDGVPLELRATSMPEEIKNTTFAQPISAPINELLANHPSILDKQFKKSQYEIERRLKRDKLKPKLKLKYNPLFATSQNSLAPEYLISNYKWGVGFSMPVLFRKEKAAVQKTTIAIKEVEFAIFDAQNSLRNKIEANLGTQTILEEQVILQQQNVANYIILLDAETEKYSLGESSVFLINKRQEKYLEARIKLIELSAKSQFAKLEYLYFTGTLLEFIVSSNPGN